jgi:phosphodiesterase/alkaline phosphatase D-like protein
MLFGFFIWESTPQSRMLTCRLLTSRGYVRCTVTPKTWKSDYQVVENVTEPGATIATRASFVVENGHPCAKQD